MNYLTKKVMEWRFAGQPAAVTLRGRRRREALAGAWVDFLRWVGVTGLGLGVGCGVMPMEGWFWVGMVGIFMGLGGMWWAAVAWEQIDWLERGLEESDYTDQKNHF